jgi:ribose transport system substrate-binding protein
MRLRATLFAAAVLLVVVGCGSGEKTSDAKTTGSTTGASASAGKTYKIAVIPKGATHEFWKSVRAGAMDADKEMDDVEIIWKGPVKEDNRDDQIKVVEDFTLQQVDGIVLAPLDDAALRQPVVNAQNSKIPVLIIDSDLKDVDTVSFVATDNYKGGEMAAQKMIELLGGKGKIVVLRYMEGSASTMNREQGFLDAIKKSPGIEVVSSNQHAGATTETAQAASESLLQRYRNPDGTLSIQGIYTPNESSTFGMLRVLQDSGWAGKVKFVGFDASPKLVEGLKSGQIDGLVLQNPRRMGYLGVKTIIDHIKGQSVEKRIDTGATLVTGKNMTEPEVAKLLEPPQE